MKSLQGHFLVAAPHQLGPNFVEAVILVVEHADHGAFGVIVNCPRDRHEGDHAATKYQVALGLASISNWKPLAWGS